MSDELPLGITDKRRKSGYVTSYNTRPSGLVPHKRGLKSPKKKGDTYERELAAWFTSELGIPVYRTPLSGGGFGFARSSLGPSADLTGLPDLHVEAKRTEKFAPRGAIEQAEKSLNKSFSNDMAVVINRPGHTLTEDSLCVLRLSDFVKLYSAYLDSLHVKRTMAAPSPDTLQEDTATAVPPINPLRS